MKQNLDTVWQRRGTSWVWDEEARNQVCEAGQVWSLRQFLQAVGNWPDDLPSNGNNTVVVAGLEASLDLLTPEDAEAWLGDAIKDAILSFQAYYEGEAALIFWLPQATAVSSSTRQPIPSNGAALRPTTKVCWPSAASFGVRPTSTRRKSCCAKGPRLRACSTCGLREV